jgi:biotin synthase-related radical SAM superfamily protein
MLKLTVMTFCISWFLNIEYYDKNKILKKTILKYILVYLGSCSIWCLLQGHREDDQREEHQQPRQVHVARLDRLEKKPLETQKRRRRTKNHRAGWILFCLSWFRQSKMLLDVKFITEKFAPVLKQESKVYNYSIYPKTVPIKNIKPFTCSH